MTSQAIKNQNDSSLYDILGGRAEVKERGNLSVGRVRGRPFEEVEDEGMRRKSRAHHMMFDQREAPWGT